jgi:hypothetical protein
VVLALAAVAATLVPTRHTATAVAWCVAGPFVCLVGGALLARTAVGERLARSVERAGARVARAIARPGPVAFAFGVGAALALALAAAGAIFLIERTPGVFDGAMYLFQAKIFASGRLVAPLPPLPEFFRTPYAILEADRWYTQYPPGYPALLALGVWLGAPWLVNPIVTGLNAALTHRLGRRLVPERDARLAAVLAAVSPFALLTSSDFTSNPPTLCLATAFLLATTAFVQDGRVRAAALAGAAGAMAFTVRPYSAAGVCLPFALLLLATLVRRRAARAAFAVALGAAPFALAFVLYNQATTGAPTELGYTHLHGAAHVPGHGIADWSFARWTRLVHNAAKNLNALNKDLFQLPLPALALVAAAFAARRARPWEWALLLSFVSLAGFYFFFPAASFYLGPRYLFEALTPLAILSARGITATASALRPEALAPRTRRTLVLAVALALFVLWPFAMTARLRLVRAGYSDPRILEAIAREEGAAHALVFAPSTPAAAFVACFSANRPLLDGPLVCARDRGDDNERLRAHFPGRRALRWDSERLVPLPAER